MRCATPRLSVPSATRWNAPSRFIEEAGIQKSERKSAGARERETDEAVDLSSPSRTLPLSHSPALTAFYVGARVRHPEFGVGKIMEKSGTGDSLKVVVLFDNGQWKKLLVKYAGLEKL